MRNLPSLLPKIFLAGMIFLLSGNLAANAAEEQMGELYSQETAIREDALQKLYAENFEELDKLAVKYTESKERVPNGIWKLRLFSDGLCFPKNKQDHEEWSQLIEKLEKWRKKTGTAFALSALGHGQLERGWNIRGRDFANEIEADKWGPFGEWVEKAADNLDKAIKKDPGCVDAYKSLLHVGISQGWPKEKMQAMFDRAVKVEPEYYEYYYNMAFYKMERWHGEQGDPQRFLNTIPDLVPGEQGLAIYTRTAMQLHPYYQEGFFGSGEEKVHWGKTKKGFEVILKTYPGIYNRNKYAFLALLAKDVPAAKKILLELKEKDQFLVQAWGDPANLNMAKEWLAQFKQDGF